MSLSISNIITVCKNSVPSPRTINEMKYICIQLRAVYTANDDNAILNRALKFESMMI